MSFITKLFSGGAGNIVESIGNALDNLVTTKEEKMTLENEIKKAEMQYNLELKKLNIAEEELFLKDVQSARTREVDIQSNQNASTLGKNISSYLAIAATVLCFAMFFTLIIKNDILSDPKNAALKDIVIYILGVLSALLTQVYSYYFGSSSGSADKTRTIAQAFENRKP